MNCPKCNTVLLPNAKFCGSCGFQMQSQAQQTPNSPSAAQMPPVNQTPNYSNQPQYQNQPSGGQEAFHFDADGRGQGRGYLWEIKHQGAFALAIVNLQAEQSISAEAGAMVSMSANIDLQSELKGGVFGALKRAVGGESAFVSTFTARGGNGEVTLAPGTPGDVVGIEMNTQVLMVQSSSYLAGDVGLQVETKFGGAKSWLGGEGLFVLQVSGSGLLLISSFGSIHRKTLGPGEQYVVDTGHLVAWEGHMQYNLRKAA